MQLDPETSKRFWARVEIVDDETSCWLWLGGRYGRGYGSFPIRPGKNVTASRFAYADKVGPIPEGKFVCHHCDVRLCVRPDHLFVGTQKDNIGDAVAKGRMQSGEQHWTKRMPERIPHGADTGGVKGAPKRRGPLNGNAKLTDDDVREIRRLHASKTPLAEICARFGISKAQVSRIGTGKRWAHL